MKRILSFLLIVLVIGILFSSHIQAQLLEKKTVSLELAKRIAAVAEAVAVKNNWTMVITILDDGGNLVYLEKMDNTQNGSIQVSMQKAHTAVFFKRPTKVFEDMVNNGRNSILGLQNAIPIEGGLPLIVNGVVIGAIGVSGAKSNEDGIVAKAGVDFLAGQ
jgi:glc operon protein GlcG